MRVLCLAQRRASLCLWLLCVAACSPAVEVPKWGPIDPEAVRSVVDHPTARLADDPDSQALIASLMGPSSASDVDAATATLQDLLQRDGPPAMVDGDDDPAANASGTVVFLKLACPGVEADGLDPTFDSGLIRIDSARLTEAVLETLRTQDELMLSVLEGDFLLSFVECSSGASVYEGRAPSWYVSGESPAVITSLALEAFDEASGMTTPFISDAVLEATRSRFTHPSDAGGTYTIEFDDPSGTRTLHAADGAVVCETATGLCTGP